jgi:hypothetical protein
MRFTVNGDPHVWKDDTASYRDVVSRAMWRVDRRRALQAAPPIVTVGRADGAIQTLTEGESIALEDGMVFTVTPRS